MYKLCLYDLLQTMQLVTYRYCTLILDFCSYLWPYWTYCTEASGVICERCIYASQIKLCLPQASIIIDKSYGTFYRQRMMSIVSNVFFFIISFMYKNSMCYCYKIKYICNFKLTIILIGVSFKSKFASLLRKCNEHRMM